LEPQRNQLELRAVDLEATLEAGHPARSVWALVEGMDLSSLYTGIGSVEGHAGRPAIDPRILMALWLYATIDGVGSARKLARLCEDHDVYRWICGGVSVNYHTLADFRVGHVKLLDEELSRGVAVLVHQGLVGLKRVAQDGMRVRASAGASSFRRGSSLKKCLKVARGRVRWLRREVEQDPGESTRRGQAARTRAAEERTRRVEEALEELEALARAPRKKRAQKPGESDEEHAKRSEPRASSSDPQARVMKMPDGGFRPAYNVQFCTDTASQVIVGVDVSNCGTDNGQLGAMLEQLAGRYERLPEEALVDGDYVNVNDFDAAYARGVTVYAPVSKPKAANRDPHMPCRGDSPALAQWRVRMGCDQAREIYRERAATAECVNAIARQRGLLRFMVRGQRKVRAVALWHALAHNLMRARAFGALAPA
jgi:transposase